MSEHTKENLPTGQAGKKTRKQPARDASQGEAGGENKTSAHQQPVAVDFENLYKRALADYQNLQKQTAREKEEFARYVKANLIVEFLPIYENLKSAVQHADKDSHDSWLKGVRYVIKQFEDMLANNGVVILDPSEEDFNPAEHEAVEKLPADDEKKLHKIAKVVQVGYKLGEKVIQPAKVVVYGE